MRLIHRRSSWGLLLALGIPAFLILTALSTLADTSPSPGASPSVALPGDPAKGATLYAQNCTSCHGGSLEGGVGPALNPIERLPGVSNVLDPQFLIDVIANGRTPQAGDPRQTAMPPKGGNAKLTGQDVNDLAA